MNVCLLFSALTVTIMSTVRVKQRIIEKIPLIDHKLLIFEEMFSLYINDEVVAMQIDDKRT